MTSHFRSLRRAALLLAIVVSMAAPLLSETQQAERRAPLAELWVQPSEPRDLFHGLGGPELAPNPTARYQIIAIKVGGFSDGYDVRDPDGREWSVKLPPEASTEVAASRILWGIGFHQPPLYFLREWQASEPETPNPQLPGRFREQDPDFYGLDRESEWSFADNPFVGTRELKGLLVLQAMLGNSDLKPSNNALYTLEKPLYGVRRWWVVRDVGHTFGRTGIFQSPRGDIESFEATGFIRRVQGSRVELEYNGRHRMLFADLSTDDVRWICAQLERLSDRQWRDAFRAAGYDPTLADRFIRKVKSKMAHGLALTPSRALTTNVAER